MAGELRVATASLLDRDVAAASTNAPYPIVRVSPKCFMWWRSKEVVVGDS